jgi:hypothetical protein
MYVVSILYGCCKKVDLDVHILQWLYTYIASVFSKCFIYFKRMLEVFYLCCIYCSDYTYILRWLYTYVAVAIHICYKRMFQMFHLFQTYVVGSAFVLQVFHE